MAVRIPQYQVDNVEDLMKEIENHKDKRVFIMFIGSTDESGDSWCPDCRVAEPFVEKGLDLAPDNSVFILATVGDREAWKSKTCINKFKTDERFKLTAIPTLMEWKGEQSVKKTKSAVCREGMLVEGECADAKQVHDFFK